MLIFLKHLATKRPKWSLCDDVIKNTNCSRKHEGVKSDAARSPTYCAGTLESLKKLFSRVGQRKKSRVAEPRVIFGVPTSENNF
jgi:hypothetical protein